MFRWLRNVLVWASLKLNKCACINGVMQKNMPMIHLQILLETIGDLILLYIIVNLKD